MHNVEGRREKLAARSQRPQRLALLKERQQQGLEVAHKCARILKQEFGAVRVVLFRRNISPMTMVQILDMSWWMGSW